MSGREGIFRVSVKDLSGIQTDPKLALALGGKTRLVFSLGAFATVFQAEVFAIMAAIRESITRGYNGSKITIFTDSQGALKALELVTVKSKLVL